MHPLIRPLAALALLALAASPVAGQTNWPDKPVKLVVGFTAGSATDISGRIFAQKFAEEWGQAVVVENVSGNSGAIGVDRVAKAVPDGYTLMWSGNAAITVLPASRIPRTTAPTRSMPIGSCPVVGSTRTRIDG